MTGKWRFGKKPKVDGGSDHFTESSLRDMGEGTSRRAVSVRMRVWREIRGSRLASVGLVFLIAIVGIAIFAPYLTSYEPRDQDLLSRLESPSRAHWMGTDEVGRDVFTRLAYGARISLFVGLIGTAGGVVIGTIVGLVSGFFGRWIDQFAMRIIDVMYAFPGILLALLIISILGPSLWNVILALVIWGTPTLSRIVRATVYSLKEQEFIEAARAMGATPGRIMARHLLPNAMAPIIVYSTLGVAGAILTAAGLGFLGLGVPPPTPEWGAMLSDGRKFLRQAPHLVMFPGFTIFFTLLALNFLGDALRDALDPHMSRPS